MSPHLKAGLSDENAARNDGAADGNAATVPQRKPLTSTERSRNSRARKRDAAKQARGYRWADATPGNELAMVHGASSERRIAPLADQIAAALLADPDTPPYLLEPSYAAVVRAWSRAEAVVSLLWDWLAEQDIGTALADTTTTDEDERRSRSKSRRHTTSRHVESVLTQLHRHETRAMNLRSRLGIDPLSRARLGKDIAGQRLDLARLFAEISGAEHDGGN